MKKILFLLLTAVIFIGFMPADSSANLLEVTEAPADLVKIMSGNSMDIHAVKSGTVPMSVFVYSETLCGLEKYDRYERLIVAWSKQYKGNALASNDFKKIIASKQCEGSST